jgi:CelD/BcsL family acetyltransferase involved in cellulose biosynthesis
MRRNARHKRNRRAVSLCFPVSTFDRRTTVQTQKLPVDHPPQGEAADADARITRLRDLNARLAMSAIEIDVVPSMQMIEPEWRALEADNLNSLHQGYDWCASWAKAFNRQPAIIRGRSGEQTAFILPVEVVRTRGVRTAKFIGADHSNINTGLFSADFAASIDALDAHRFTAQLRDALAGKADLLLLQNIPLTWRERRSPLSVLPMVQNQNHAYRLPLLETLEATLKQLNAKSRRKKFRVQSKRLEELGGFDYIAGGTAGDQHALLDHFFRLKSERFKAMGLPDVFADAETKAFLHGAIDIRDPSNPLSGLEMHAIRLKGDHAGHLAAIAGISRKGDHVICQFSAIDDSVAADASPGEFLFWQMISGLHGKGVSLFDFGLGDQSYKRSWAPAETAHYDVVLPITARGAAAGLMHRFITRSKAYIKSQQRLYRAAQRLRRLAGV